MHVTCFYYIWRVAYVNICKKNVYPPALLKVLIYTLLCFYHFNGIFIKKFFWKFPRGEVLCHIPWPLVWIIELPPLLVLIKTAEFFISLNLFRSKRFWVFGVREQVTITKSDFERRSSSSTNSAPFSISGNKVSYRKIVLSYITLCYFITTRSLVLKHCT